MKKNLALFAAVLLTSSIFFISCSKDEVNGTSTLHVRLTDQPIALDAVFVDIREVKVKMLDDNTENGWISLNTNAGIYDLLQLQNGTDVLLGTATLPTGIVREIRFILGTDNTVVASGIIYPLTIPSGAESGLKIKVNKNLSAPLETLIIDFDAALSIKLEADGYKLRPVLKVK